MTCQNLRPTKCTRDFEPMTLGSHICGAISRVKSYFHFLGYSCSNNLTRRIALPPATRTPSSIHTTLLRLRHKARPGKRRINLKLAPFVGFETGDCSTPKVPKELGRTYLVILPLCVWVLRRPSHLYKLQTKEDAK